MSENFVTYEQALVLKKLGFNWPVNHRYFARHFQEMIPDEDDFEDYIKANTCYDNCNGTEFYVDYVISAPTLAQVQKRLRTEHKTFVTSDVCFKDYYKGNFSNPKYQYITVDMRKNSRASRIESDYNRGMLYNTPEEALSAGITECLEFLRNETTKTSEENSNP